MQMAGWKTVAAIAFNMTELTCSKDQTIFRDKDLSTNLMVIVDGYVEITMMTESGQACVLERLTAGHVINANNFIV
jgi:CRP-like cAMP-binding protein